MDEDHVRPLAPLSSPSRGIPMRPTASPLLVWSTALGVLIGLLAWLPAPSSPSSPRIPSAPVSDAQLQEALVRLRSPVPPPLPQGEHDIPAANLAGFIPASVAAARQVEARASPQQYHRLLAVDDQAYSHSAIHAVWHDITVAQYVNGILSGKFVIGAELAPGKSPGSTWLHPFDVMLEELGVAKTKEVFATASGSIAPGRRRS